jgi:hypothetical protein
LEPRACDALIDAHICHADWQQNGEFVNGSASFSFLFDRSTIPQSINPDEALRKQRLNTELDRRNICAF